MTFHLYFSIWNKYGRTVYDRYNAWHEHFGNKVLLDVDGYKSNYYYVQRYKYIQLNSEEEFNNFKSSHDLYTATYEEEPLDTENKTINDYKYADGSKHDSNYSDYRRRCGCCWC